MAVHTKALVTMEEICDLEMRIDALAADNDRLIQLWEEMDLNHNAELSFSEVLTFMSRHHPILAEKHLLRHAFLASADDEDKSGCKIVKPEHFRLFLINVFRSAKLAPHFVEGTEATETAMEELRDLEMQFDALCADNNRLIELWIKMDLNQNGELGFTEVTRYMTKNHMILGNVPVLREAFQKAVDMDEDRGCNVVKPAHFRAFLGHIFRSAENYIKVNCLPGRASTDSHKQQAI